VQFALDKLAKLNQMVIFMAVDVSEKNVNRAMKSFMAGFVGGIVAPLSALQFEPARRLQLDAVKRASASPAQAWRTVGDHLRAAVRNNDPARGKEAA
jgi:hypothetical protein